MKIKVKDFNGYYEARFDFYCEYATWPTRIEMNKKTMKEWYNNGLVSQDKIGVEYFFNYDLKDNELILKLG